MLLAIRVKVKRETKYFSTSDSLNVSEPFWTGAHVQKTQVRL